MIVVLAAAGSAAGADRLALGPREREAVFALLDAVDAVQQGRVDSDAAIAWDAHTLKSLDHRSYVPFSVSLDRMPRDFLPAALYVRAVGRPPAQAAVEQHSAVRDWLRTPNATPRPGETVAVPLGELPVGGPAASSSRLTTQVAAQSSAALELQRRNFEKQKMQDEERRKAQERLDPTVYPFEEYYFLESKGVRDRIARAIALPPGEYDLYVAMLDRARGQKPRTVVLDRQLAVPDFWNDDLRLSTLMISSEARTLASPLPRKELSERPFTFGLVDAAPSVARTFSTRDVLSVVYQICNYGSPDSDLTAEYKFFRTDTGRTFFNATLPQTFRDDDLPPPQPWESQAFAMQSIPLGSFPPGGYELEVTVRDRVTRATAKAVAAFTVK